jgi:L,D-transpeptidase catalytic domain
VRLSTFAGVPVSPGHALRSAWVSHATADVRGAPDGRPIASLSRRTPIALTGPCRLGACPVDDGWIRAADLAVAQTLPRPPQVGPLERWLDVDLATEILVAYVGDRPVYATLVSTGVGEPPSPFATPTGLFRIRSKHEVARMDNLEHTGVAPYSYDVPLVQYFSGGKALHAAPWHDHFGRPSSHGCVGLAPRDAEWLFAFTSPTPPSGAPDVDASEAQPGTWVRVRAGAATTEPPRAQPGAAPAADDVTAAR